MISWLEGPQLNTDPRNIVSVSKIGVHEINSLSGPKLSEKSISAILEKNQRAPCEKIAQFEKSCQNVGRFFNARGSLIFSKNGRNGFLRQFWSRKAIYLMYSYF